MARPPAADGDRGGIEWTERLTLETVGRVPTKAPPSKRGEVVGLMNTAVLNWQPESDEDEGPNIWDMESLSDMAEITYESVRRWFGLPGADGMPRQPRNAVPLKIVGRKQRGFLPMEYQRRMCTIAQSQYDYNDILYDLDSKKRHLDLLRALFAACVCASNPAPFLDVGERYLPGRNEPGAGGIYRQDPIFGKYDRQDRLMVYEYDPEPCSSLQEAVERVQLCTDPDSGLSIDSGHRLACAWVRIWIEPGDDYPYVVRLRHTYPKKDESYELESFDVRQDSPTEEWDADGTLGE